MQKTILTLILFLSIEIIWGQWTSMGPSSTAGLTRFHLDTVTNVLYVGDVEGYRYYKIDEDVWVDYSESGIIGKETRSITAHPNNPGKIIMGRVNAWFKGYMAYSDDWGVTETHSFESDGGTITDVKYCPSEPDTFFACGWSDITPGDLLKSTDGGHTWSQSTNYHHTVMTEVAIHPTDANIVYVSGDAKITKSIDNGVTWSESYSGLPSNLGVYCVSIDPFKTENLLCSNDNGTYLSTDGATTWNMINNNEIKNFCYHTLVENYIAAITLTEPHTILLSTDKGNTWNDITDGFPGDGLKDISFSKDGTKLYVLSRYGVYSREIDLSAGLNSENMYSYKLSVSPNPFKENSLIHFSNPSNDTKLKIKLYDLLGQEVPNVSQQIIDNETIRINKINKHGEALQSGIYIVNLYVNDSSVSSVKLVVANSCE